MIRLIASILVVAPLLASAQESRPRVPDGVRKALDAFLRADAKSEKAALDKVLKELKGDLAVAAEAILAHPPLTQSEPGTRHGLKFASAGLDWEYSIRLPKGYDGKRRFPVLVLPDHMAVDAESGIGFWEQAKEVEDVVVFRPVILKHQEDSKRFPQDDFIGRDQAIAGVMGDALVHLRLHYAVDPARFFMTGLSQAGYYTWLYAMTFPDQFAAIVPESAGGPALRVHFSTAANLRSVAVRILHSKGDEICPFADAERMRDEIGRAGGKAELIAYTDADYPGGPYPRSHPGPHHLRVRNVMAWAPERKREIPTTLTRVLRHPRQGLEGRFRIAPPKAGAPVRTLTCGEKEGMLTVSGGSAAYRVSPEDLLAKRPFRTARGPAAPSADLKLLLTAFKALGDRERLVAAEIPVGE